MSPRPTATPLGGMLHRAPDGDLVTVQTTGLVHPSPDVVQQLWDSVTQRMSPKAWKGIEPEAHLIIRWATPPVTLTCGHCRRSIGRFRSYRAGEEVGIVCVDTKRGRLTPKRDMRDDHDPRYQLDGERGRYAHRTFAHFECPRCHNRYNRQIDRLGQHLWDTRPGTYALTP